jgi:hypothetical protein
MTEEIASPQPCAWVKLFHPSGLDVRVPLPLDHVLPEATWLGLRQSIDNALASGWHTEAPGLDAGEQKESIGWVCRLQKEHDDGTLTNRIDLYADDDRMSWKCLSVYLNNASELVAFEQASGLKVDNLPIFVGGSAPERGSSKQTDAFIVRAPKAFGMICKANPRYDPNETDVKKKKPKRVFARWADQQPTLATPNGHQSGEAGISSEQWKQLQGLVPDKVGLGVVLKRFGVSRGSGIPAKRFDEAVLFSRLIKAAGPSDQLQAEVARKNNVEMMIDIPTNKLEDAIKFCEAPDGPTPF